MYHFRFFDYTRVTSVPKFHNGVAQLGFAQGGNDYCNVTLKFLQEIVSYVMLDEKDLIICNLCGKFIVIGTASSFKL